MSALLMVEAMQAKVGNATRKLVLIKLADNASDDGVCWPSYQHVADQCECSRSAVRKHIKDLEQAGFLKIINRLSNTGEKKNQSNKYVLTVKNGDISRLDKKPVSQKSIAIETSAVPPKNTHTVPSESTPVSPENTLPVSSGDTRTCHSSEPVKEPINKSVLLDQRFVEFYSAYPIKKSKGAAEKAFKKLNPDDLLFFKIMRGLRDQIEYRAKAVRLNIWVENWKHPSTWLNQKCWDDEMGGVSESDAKPMFSRTTAIDNNDTSWAEDLNGGLL